MRLKFYYKIDLRRNVREPKSLDTRQRLEGLSYLYTSNYTVLILIYILSHSLHEKNTLKTAV